MKLKPIVGSLVFRLSSTKDITRMERGWRIFEFSLFKWKELPEPGERIQKRHYSGIRILFAYWLPIESV